jgi:Tfp pilus assembly protein PilN
MACSRRDIPEARIRKEVVLVNYSRQEIVKMLRRTGLDEVADTAEATLPDPVDAEILSQFCTAQGVTLSILTDRMGASP